MKRRGVFLLACFAEHRWAEGHYDCLRALAADLVSRAGSVIVTLGGPPPTALAAKAATSTIPIVFHMGPTLSNWASLGAFGHSRRLLGEPAGRRGRKHCGGRCRLPLATAAPEPDTPPARSGFERTATMSRTPILAPLLVLTLSLCLTSSAEARERTWYYQGNGFSVRFGEDDGRLTRAERRRTQPGPQATPNVPPEPEYYAQPVHPRLKGQYAALYGAVVGERFAIPGVQISQINAN